MGIFNPDGWLARILNRIGDLIVLNVITLICCIPVFTIGAAVSSMFYVTLLMVKNEEGKVIPTFLGAFKENFRQSTLIWLIGGGLSAFLLLDIWLLGKTELSFARPYKILLFVLFLLALLFTIFSLVVQARFENTLKNTIKNGVLFCVIHFLKSILMYMVLSIPVALLFLSLRALSVDVLIGFSGPAYLTSIYFRDLFKDFEPKKESGEIEKEIETQV